MIRRANDNGANWMTNKANEITNRANDKTFFKFSITNERADGKKSEWQKIQQWPKAERANYRNSELIAYKTVW